jgi:hypothetical protein
VVAKRTILRRSGCPVIARRSRGRERQDFGEGGFVALGRKQKYGHVWEMRQAIIRRDKQEGGVVVVYAHRKLRRCAAAEADPDAKFHRPGGVFERERRGETERGARGSYRRRGAMNWAGYQPN